MFGIKLFWTSVVLLCVVEISIASRRRYVFPSSVTSSGEISSSSSEIGGAVNNNSLEVNVSSSRSTGRRAHPRTFSSDEYRNLRRTRRNTTTESVLVQNQPSQVRKSGIRRRRLRPKVDGEERSNPRRGRGGPRPPRQGVFRRKFRNLETDNNQTTENFEALQLDPVTPSPSFINYEDSMSTPDSSTTHGIEISSETTVKPTSIEGFEGSRKPAKKYYPVFRKSNTTPKPDAVTPPNSIENESKSETSSEVPKKKSSGLKLTLKNTSGLTSRINPKLFSLGNVNDLDPYESANPFLEGGAAPISIDIAGDNPNNHRFLHHPLLNSDSILSKTQGIRVGPENSTATTTEIVPSATMADDLLLSDEMPSPTFGEPNKSVRVKKKSQFMLSSTIGATHTFLHGLKSKKCDPPIVAADNSLADSTTTPASNSIILQESESMESSNTDKNSPQTTTDQNSGTTESHLFSVSTLPPQSPLPEDTIIVTLQDSPTFSGSTSTSSLNPTAAPESEDSSAKVQRHISTTLSPPSPTFFANILPPPSDFKIPQHVKDYTTSTTINPFDFGSILNLFQISTPAPTTVPLKPLGGTEQPLPILNGLLDSLNSVYSVLGALSPSAITTPKPTTQSPFQTALSNMIDVLSNPFKPIDPFKDLPGSNRANPIPVPSNSLTLATAPRETPKPIVPLNPQDYLSQLLKLGSDLGISAQDMALVTNNKESGRQAQPSQPQQVFARNVPSATAKPTARPTTTASPLFDFSSLFGGNWLTGGVTTTPAPSLGLLSLLTGLTNPFASLLTPRQPGTGLFGSATNQQPSIVKPDKDPNGLYYWLDMNTFLPTQGADKDAKVNPTTGIRPKLGQKDYFYRVRRRTD